MRESVKRGMGGGAEEEGSEGEQEGGEGGIPFAAGGEGEQGGHGDDEGVGDEVGREHPRRFVDPGR